MTDHFDLKLLGTDIPHHYRAVVPNLDGSSLAEEPFRSAQ